MRKKIHSYLGLARRAGKLLIGQGTCSEAMEKKKLALLFMTGDVAENTQKKLRKTAEKTGTPCVVYGTSEELSKVAGAQGSAVYGITDENFAKAILTETEKANIDKEVF